MLYMIIWVHTQDTYNVLREYTKQHCNLNIYCNFRIVDIYSMEIQFFIKKISLIITKENNMITLELNA